MLIWGFLTRGVPLGTLHGHVENYEENLHRGHFRVLSHSKQWQNKSCWQQQVNRINNTLLIISTMVIMTIITLLLHSINSSIGIIIISCFQ